jgi:hypothetical protein
LVLSVSASSQSLEEQKDTFFSVFERASERASVFCACILDFFLAWYFVEENSLSWMCVCVHCVL